MRIVLLQHVKNLGQKGEVKEVSTGYFQNFLAPRRYASPAIGGQVKVMQVQREKAVEKLEAMKESALAVQSKLEGKSIVIPAKTSESGKLYASIHAKDIAEALKEQLHVQIPEKQIILKEPIKTTGEFPITLHLFKDIFIELVVHITA